jgi:hypothetical protein
MKGDLVLLHHLEERALRLRRRAVDLVGQQQMREHRAPDDAQRVRGRIEHGVAGDVRRHHVGRELHARVPERERFGQRTHEQRLAQPGHALDEHVPRRHERDEHLVEHRRLADHRLLDGVAQQVEALGGVGDARLFS